MTEPLHYPKPLHHELDQEQLEDLLNWCVAQNASDIVLCPDDQVWLQKDGQWHAVTDSCLTDAEVQYMVNLTSGQSNRAGYVRAGHSLDYAFGLRVPGERSLRQRFRVNATSSNKGLYVVLRVLPRELPRLEDMNLPKELVEALYPDAGLVVVSGVMGSGKSTLLAAALHKAVLAGGLGRQILTLEDPVEFDFSVIPHQARSAPITQSAIGVDVESWSMGVRSLTRRKGEVVMVGECRDKETITSLLSTVEQGVTAYTTVHAQDVPQTLTRLIHLFPEEERDGAMAVLFANSRLLIHQRLVPSNKRPSTAQTSSRDFRQQPQYGRCALREYLIVDKDVRTLLHTLPAHRLIEELRELVRQRGHSLSLDARTAWQNGLIGDDVLLAVVREQEGDAAAGDLLARRKAAEKRGYAPRPAAKDQPSVSPQAPYPAGCRQPRQAAFMPGMGGMGPGRRQHPMPGAPAAQNQPKQDRH